MSSFIHYHASELRKASLRIADELTTADTEARAVEAASVLADILSSVMTGWSKAETVYGAQNLVTFLRSIANRKPWGESWAAAANATGRRARKILLDAPDHAFRWLGSA